MSGHATYIGVKPALPTKATAQSNTELINQYVETGYDFVLLSITNVNFREKSRRIFQKAKSSYEIEVPKPTLTDINIFSGPHIQNMVGLVASWIELESDDELICEFSKQVLINELEYAKFIGLTHIIIPPPKDLIKLSNYSESILDALEVTKSHNIIISISLPMCKDFEGDTTSFLDIFSTWDMWNSIRTSTDYNGRLKISLAVPKGPLPAAVVERWFAEPISCLLLSSSIFLINGKGFPVLSKSNQILLHTFHFKSPIYLLHGLEKRHEKVCSSSYMAYINYLASRDFKSATKSKMDDFSRKHYDALLPPLQPLSTNLDDFTYNVFQKDDTKYESYEKAICQALIDFKHLSNINVAIVGAGKGGLVDVTIKSIKRLGISSKCCVTAIEKNCNAVIYLNKRNQTDWDSVVEVLNIDMRDWSPMESYNLIISELLGSFGCNELAPECLYALETVLDRDNGIFIPQSYTSSIAPIFTPKLHRTLKEQNDRMAFHKEYVVKLMEFNICSTKMNDIWSFNHPLKSVVVNTSPSDSFDTYSKQHYKKTTKRRTISTFKVRYKTVIHGIAGFFSAKLYKDFEISTRPDKHTEDLISWFSLYFPLETPIYVTDDTELEVFIAREVKDGKVWYEWGCETFVYLVTPGKNCEELQVRVRTGVSKIHNHNGKGFFKNLNLKSGRFLDGQGL